MANDQFQDSYNKFSLLPQISYNITKYLMDNDELIWRLLYYNTPNAWNETECPNLTAAQKGALVWGGYGNETDYKVFFAPGEEYSWNIQATILRIMPVEVVPNTYIYGTQSIGFEVYTHYQLSALSNYSTRVLTIIQRLIEVMNGADIEGVGRLYFNARASSRCKSYPIGQIPYRGMAIILCNNALG